MARSSFIVVSDDQALVQKAQQFGQMHGVTVQVMSPEHWESIQNKETDASVPSLAIGSSAVEGGAKVLPFPGSLGSVQLMGVGSDPRRTVSTINQMESVAIENAIAAFRGNLTEAARALGIGRATLYRKVKQYNIDPSAARRKKAA